MIWKKPPYHEIVYKNSVQTWQIALLHVACTWEKEREIIYVCLGNQKYKPMQKKWYQPEPMNKRRKLNHKSEKKETLMTSRLYKTWKRLVDTPSTQSTPLLSLDFSCLLLIVSWRVGVWDPPEVYMRCPNITTHKTWIKIYSYTVSPRPT